MILIMFRYLKKVFFLVIYIFIFGVNLDVSRCFVEEL